MRHLLGVIVVALLGCAPPIEAEVVRVGNEFRVNTYTPGHQTFPAAAMDGAGNFVVVWQSTGQDGDERGVFGRRFDSSGHPRAGEFQINTWTTGIQRSPSIGMSDVGDFVVVWAGQDEGSPYQVYDVVGQRFDSSGIPQGGQFLVNTWTTFRQYSPDIGMNASGEFVVVWHSKQGYLGDSTHENDIFGQRFDSLGAVVGSEFQVNTITINTQWRPQVTVSDAGGFVVAWHGVDPNCCHYITFGRTFDPAGNPTGSDFRLSEGPFRHEGAPGLASQPSGEVVAAWTDFCHSPGCYYDVLARRFDSQGAPSGSHFQVNTCTAGHQTGPFGIGIEESGGFVVTWDGFGENCDVPDDSASGVLARWFDSLGSPVGENFQVNTHTTDDQTAPSLAMEGSGRFVIVWMSQYQDGDGYGIFGQRFWIPPCSPYPGDISDLFLEAGPGGADLTFTWTDSPSADDYVLFEDAAAQGDFEDIAGVAASGLPGLAIPAPSASAYYLLAARNLSCGLGLKR